MNPLLFVIKITGDFFGIVALLGFAWLIFEFFRVANPEAPL